MPEVLEIQKQKGDGHNQLSLSGRLDAFGSRTLEDELQDQLKNGHYNIVLNFREVSYMSSAGIRVLIKFYKELKGVGGYLRFTKLSEKMNAVVELAGLKHLFEDEEGEATEQGADEKREIRTESAVFNVLQQQEKYMSLRTTGDPTLLNNGGYTNGHAVLESFPGSKYALGLGAIGSEFEECKQRFGEYMAVGNAAIYLPTDGTKSADYMQHSNQLVPEVLSLYSIIFEGAFGTFLNFEAGESAKATSLSEIAKAALESQSSKAIGMVMLAETSGLSGCSLNTSPVAGINAGGPFDFPAVKEHMNFTTEPEYQGCLTLTVGVVHTDTPELMEFTRPLKDGLNAHFHTAIFGFRPAQRDNPDLGKAIDELLEGSSLMGLLHLLDDDRPHNGIGESMFTRGACWIGSIDNSQKV